jgi:two-component system nitrate/nitrite response regulator NarL
MIIRLLVVSGIRFFREGLAQLLREDVAFLVVDAVAPEAALRATDRHRPDIALLHLPVPAGPDLLREIRLRPVRPACIALAASNQENSIVAWAEAGVSGYVPADGSLAQLRDSIRIVRTGGAACSPHVSAVLLRQVAQRSGTETIGAGTDVPELTGRELEIARLIERGFSNKEIARALSIALPTVKNHVHSILEKLQVDRRTKVLLRDLRSSQV